MASTTTKEVTSFTDIQFSLTFLIFYFSFRQTRITMNSITENNSIGKLQERFQSRNVMPEYTEVAATGPAPFQMQVRALLTLSLVNEKSGGNPE
jgi:hypothetical protein